MPKSRAKKSEELVADAFEDAGFETYIPPKAKFREQDVFGLYDVLAVDPSNFWMVQVKTSQPRGINDWFQEAGGFNRFPRVWVGYAIVHPGEGVRFARYDNEETYRWVVDERDRDLDPGAGLTEYLRGGDG